MQNTITRVEARLEEFKIFCEKRDSQIREEKEMYKDGKPDFRQAFEQTILKDIKDLINPLKEQFRAHGLVLKLEHHKKHGHFRSSDNHTNPYIVLAIESSKKSLRDRWYNCPFLIFESDINFGKVTLYSCNESLEYFSYENHPNQSDKKLVYETKLAEYTVDDILPLFENFVDKTLKNIDKLEVFQREQPMSTVQQIKKLRNEITMWKGKYYALLEKQNSLLENTVIARQTDSKPLYDS